MVGIAGCGQAGLGISVFFQLWVLRHWRAVKSTESILSAVKETGWDGIKTIGIADVRPSAKLLFRWYEDVFPKALRSFDTTALLSGAHRQTVHTYLCRVPATSPSVRFCIF